MLIRDYIRNIFFQPKRYNIKWILEGGNEKRSIFIDFAKDKEEEG